MRHLQQKRLVNLKKNFQIPVVAIESKESEIKKVSSEEDESRTKILEIQTDNTSEINEKLM
jgi:hypothetical protein